MSRRPRRPVLHRADWTDGLSTRTANAVRAFGFRSRDELAAFPRMRLRHIRSLGVTGCAEVDAWLGREHQPVAPASPRPPSIVRRAPLRLTVHLDAASLRSEGVEPRSEAVQRTAQALARELLRLLDPDSGRDPPAVRAPAGATCRRRPLSLIA